ncbi:hypothetical protein J2T57_002340 [Natronocella acetinitrilica]|uniref:Retropepsin-like aspartic endopeptidase domain-containing protein n=1 Tax=Natronocella acetinitrilica TaxID=414046 RepID=A0AAE3G7D8_9GAMM|nr:ATP-dependent zinc protease [Natronocella acetinitrilica]MCP1675192.1 hypothetical protein [Natronocella acetinitrilica]
MTRTALFTLCFCLVTPLAAQADKNRDLQILGWLEKVSLEQADLVIEAKLDTGADTSSLHAPELETFERDDEDWVRFTVTNGDGEAYTYEKPISRTVRIRSASGRSERYVVEMDICLGGRRATTEVNLADRGGLSYQMLVGRSFMRDAILVDSGAKYLAAPDCMSDKAGENGD